jgi:hypothetical protein
MKIALPLFLLTGLFVIGLPAASSAQTAPPPPSGIFLEGSGGSMTPIPGATTQDVQTHGIGKSIATQGFSKPTQTSRFAGASAEFVVKDPQPAFFFRFVDQQQMSKYMQENPMAGMSMMGGGGMLTGRDAKEYVLVKMAVDGDARVASSKGMETVKLEIQKKSAMEFEVRVAAPLTPGQYAFCHGGAGAAPTQIWAFTVK